MRRRREIVESRAHFAKAQYEAVRCRILLGSGLKAPMRGQASRRRYLMRVHLALIAYSPNRGSQFAKAQWSAVRRRISLGSGLQAPIRGSSFPVKVLNAGAFGPALRIRLFEVPFCECAMRRSKRPHPAMLLSPNTKWAYAVALDMPVGGISEGLGISIAYSRSHFANM